MTAFFKSWTFKVYYIPELASVCRLPFSGSLTELLKSSPLSLSSQVAFSTTDHASTIAPASPVWLFLCVFDGSLFSLDICYISLLILFFLYNVIYYLSYLSSHYDKRIWSKHFKVRTDVGSPVHHSRKVTGRA